MIWKWAHIKDGLWQFLMKISLKYNLIMNLHIYGYISYRNSTISVEGSWCLIKADNSRKCHFSGSEDILIFCVSWRYSSKYLRTHILASPFFSSAWGHWEKAKNGRRYRPSYKKRLSQSKCIVPFQSTGDYTVYHRPYHIRIPRATTTLVMLWTFYA